MFFGGEVVGEMAFLIFLGKVFVGLILWLRVGCVGQALLGGKNSFLRVSSITQLGTRVL